MTETTHIRIYQSDKDRIDELRGDTSIQTTIREALNALEREHELRRERQRLRDNE